jgi:hypothetical protein
VRKNSREKSFGGPVAVFVVAKGTMEGGQAESGARALQSDGDDFAPVEAAESATAANTPRPSRRGCDSIRTGF